MKQTDFNKVIMDAFNLELCLTRQGNEFQFYEQQMEMAKNFSQMTFDEWSEQHVESFEDTFKHIYG